MRVAVIGAGAAGITAAYELAKGGADVDVYEAGDAVGGLARTIDLWGQKVDLGPHRFFSNDLRVNKLWLEVVGQDYDMVDRLTRIYYKKRFFDYPLKPANALWNMGIFKAVSCVMSYFKEKIKPSFKEGQNETFESWVVGRFGRQLFDMFFKSYSEKLWGIKCDELDADFAAQRIKKFSLGEAIKSALGFGKSKHKTLVDQFAFPLEGTGVVYERMAKKVEELGGNVYLNTPVRRILHENKKVYGLELTTGETRKYDHVVSTMPFTLLVKGLGDLPVDIEYAVDQLKFRNTILVYLNVGGKDLFKDQWLYIHSPDLGTGRVTNFCNWVPQINGDSPNTILALEYWCYDEDAMWKAKDEDLIAQATKEMRSTGLIGEAPVLDGKVWRIKRCYPVYGRGYKQFLEPVVEHLKQYEGITPIGRYGSFKYNNQDHSILMGLLVAENLLHGTKHDLWQVNTDYSTYQESATITKTGLVRQGETEPMVLPRTTTIPLRERTEKEEPVHA
ncbi:MAG: FAD-dependent oxidoreductase [Gemmataceae bacterium]